MKPIVFAGLTLACLAGLGCKTASTTASSEPTVTYVQSMTQAAVGENAPRFELADTEGRTVKLETLLESGPVVLAFFPKAFTGG